MTAQYLFETLEAPTLFRVALKKIDLDLERCQQFPDTLRENLKIS